MNRWRVSGIVVFCSALAGCDPVPYGRVRLAPVPPEHAVRAADTSVIAARVLERRGFVAQPEPCFGSGRAFKGQVGDSVRRRWGPTGWLVCVETR